MLFLYAITQNEKARKDYLMGILELFLIAVGLSMDAFAVSVCKGLALGKFRWRKAGVVGLYFGVFQGGMPLIGYLLGVQFQEFIVSIDHWIAFVLLSIIGSSMIREGRRADDCEAKPNAALDVKTMLGLAVATSIDALAVGITFAFLQVAIVPAVSFIAGTTFVISVFGVKIGHVFGAKYKSRAELAGGIILILIGLKILLEHLGFLG